MPQNAQARVEEGVDLPIRDDHWRHIFDRVTIIVFKFECALLYKQYFIY